MQTFCYTSINRVEFKAQLTMMLNMLQISKQVKGLRQIEASTSHCCQIISMAVLGKSKSLHIIYLSSSKESWYALHSQN